MSNPDYRADEPDPSCRSLSIRHTRSHPTAEKETPLGELDVSLPKLYAQDTWQPLFKRLREEDPVHFLGDSANGAFWSVTRHSDIKAVETDHNTFSSEMKGISIDDPSSEEGERSQNFIRMDPPTHDEHRRTVAPSVAPGNLIHLETLARERANQKMAQIVDMFTGGDDIEVTGEWTGVVKGIERLRSVDKVVVSSPMWNFSIPYRLKHYIDLVCQPGLSFYVNDKGQYIGAITGKPIQFILASGSPFEVRFPLESDGTKTDFQRVYLEHIARFIGFEDIRFIKIEPTGMLPPDQLEVLLDKRSKEAALAAASF